MDEPVEAGRYAYPRRERLLRRAEYLSIYAQGRKHVGRAFICYTVCSPGEGRKFGFAVSRKVGKAVVRNRVKRYLREIYRTQRPIMRDDIHVVLVARPHSARLDFRQCEHAVRRLLDQGDAWRG